MTGLHLETILREAKHEFEKLWGATYRVMVCVLANKFQGEQDSSKGGPNASPAPLNETLHVHIYNIIYIHVYTYIILYTVPEIIKFTCTCTLYILSLYFH